LNKKGAAPPPPPPKPAKSISVKIRQAPNINEAHGLNGTNNKQTPSIPT